MPYRNNYLASVVETVRERTPSIAPIEDAVRSDALSHLSLMAIKSGQEVVWDPMAYSILTPEQLKSEMTDEIRFDWVQS